MFDLGWTELLLIGLVALIVVGPKDLPGMFRALGKFTAKARRMAREFSRAMEEAADESGVKDMASDLKSYANPKKAGLDALNDAVDKFDKWKPGKTSTAKRAEMTEERAEFAKKLQGSGDKTPTPAEQAKAVGAGEPAKAKPASRRKAPAKPGAAAQPKSTAKPKAAPKPKAAAKPKTASRAKPKAKPVAKDSDV